MKELLGRDPLTFAKRIKLLKIDYDNNGKGISGETIENIFVPFFTTKNSGSGIGLSIARQIIVMHGGSLELVSTNTEGSCFSIILPV